jgi:hypothetical protein
MGREKRIGLHSEYRHGNKQADEDQPEIATKARQKKRPQKCWRNDNKKNN